MHISNVTAGQGGRTPTSSNSTSWGLLATRHWDTSVSCQGSKIVSQEPSQTHQQIGPETINISDNSKSLIFRVPFSKF